MQHIIPEGSMFPVCTYLRQEKDDDTDTNIFENTLSDYDIINAEVHNTMMTANDGCYDTVPNDG